MPKRLKLSIIGQIFEMLPYLTVTAQIWSEIRTRKVYIYIYRPSIFQLTTRVLYLTKTQKAIATDYYMTVIYLKAKYKRRIQIMRSKWIISLNVPPVCDGISEIADIS